jgi:putative two-component system protein, hydrogenase maturation factor HypX/HoxX
MAAATIQLLIELRNADVPIAGTVRLEPNGQPMAFSGWLQLTEEVEALRRSQLVTPSVARCRGADVAGHRSTEPWRPSDNGSAGPMAMPECLINNARIADGQRSALPNDARAGHGSRILFMVSAHNGLSQRAQVALGDLGHEVIVAVVDCAEAMETTVRSNDPELIVCPFLKTRIPETIWRDRPCLVVHPGPIGDRGPSSLDWAIELGMREWGVTVLLANDEFDAGEPLATRTFHMREAGKSSLYRHEVRHAAVEALLEAVARTTSDERSADGAPRATPMGVARPLMKQSVRAIDWNQASTDTVLRKIRAGEGHPGVLDAMGGCRFHMFGAQRERTLAGRPGELIAQRDGAVCRATADGAAWITTLRQFDTPSRRFFKLPATRALELAGVHADLPEVVVALDAELPPEHTYREIAYEEHAGVGYLRFDFYNGAMSSDQCRRLREAYAQARARQSTRAIVLLGGTDYFSNGIHLNMIEAAEDPATESWRNLIAIDDLVHDIIETESHLVVSALAGDAAAGGVPLALAADFVVARDDVVLNPYYGHMGGLYGSEYWTYLLPRRLGPTRTAQLTRPPFTPVGTREAIRLRLLDGAFGPSLEEFSAQTRRFAERIANDGLHRARLEFKRRQRAHDERAKPLERYRTEELARCHECFFGPDRGYHEARRRFVYKLPSPQPALSNRHR